MSYVLTNWRERTTNGPWRSRGIAQDCMRHWLQRGDEYTLWELAGDPAGTATAVESGHYFEAS